jgi:hypothetical protein
MLGVGTVDMMTMVFMVVVMVSSQDTVGSAV